MLLKSELFGRFLLEKKTLPELVVLQVIVSLMHWSFPLEKRKMEPDLLLLQRNLKNNSPKASSLYVKIKILSSITEFKSGVN